MNFDNLKDEDLILIVDSEEFHCHSKVILKKSKYFESLMINNNFKEKLVVDWSNTTSFKLLLDFYYDKKIEINESNIESILNMCQKFSVDDLLKECQNFLKNSINIDNCLIYRSYSKFFFKEKENNFVLKFIRKNLKFIIESDSLIKLNYKDFKKFILDDDLGCNYIPLKIIFKLINKWVQFDLYSRLENYENLLKFFDWSDCLETDLFKLIDEENIFKKNKSLLYLFLKTMKITFDLKHKSDQYEILKTIYETLIPASLDKNEKIKENIDLHSQNSTLSQLDDPKNFDFSFYNSFELEPIENVNLDVSNNLTEDFFENYLSQNKENSNFLNLESNEFTNEKKINLNENIKKNNTEISCLIPLKQNDATIQKTKRKYAFALNFKKNLDGNKHFKKTMKNSSSSCSKNENNELRLDFVNFYATLAEWQKGITCVYCLFVATDCRKLDLHLRMMHRRYYLFEFPYSCEICSFRTKTKAELKNHCQSHYCSKCKIKFVKKKAFDIHFTKCKKTT